jgi:uncharacterized peroxidase-related enzyme
VLDNWRTAPIGEPLRAMLGFLEKLTLDPRAVTAADVEPLRAIGLGDQAIEDAVHVCALFNMYDRIADSLGFAVPDARAFELGAARLLDRGYR